jgi:hypothetical protein
VQPGTCEGSVILKLSGGREVTLAILPGTWIKRGDRLVLIDELVGNYIMAQAAPLPEGASMPGTVGSSIGERAITVEQANIPYQIARTAVAKVECPACGAMRTLHPQGQTVTVPAHAKRLTSTPRKNARWIRHGTTWERSRKPR